MLVRTVPVIAERLSAEVPAHELVTLARQGDHDAYMELCRRALPVAMGVVRRITRNEHDAEDAMQEALLSAYLNLRNFDERASFSTWFTRIGINCALMLLRKQRRSRLISLVDEDGEDLFAQLPDPRPNPERVCAEKQRRVHMLQAVQRLPANLRAVMELRHANEKPMKDVAAEMGISVPAVKSRLYRAGVQLQAAMDAKKVRAGGGLLSA